MFTIRAGLRGSLRPYRTREPYGAKNKIARPHAQRQASQAYEHDEVPDHAVYQLSPCSAIAFQRLIRRLCRSCHCFNSVA